MPILELGRKTLTIADLHQLAQPGTKARLGAAARERVRRCRRAIERVVASGATVYGVNTGFGKLAHVRIRPEQARQLQLCLLYTSDAADE